ncbi:MAG: Ni/Fe hydrogenase subunit alpha [Thermodesulfovibrionales bacterium]
MSRVIKIDYLSRVEGESGVFIKMKDGKVTNLEMRVFEAPRFFESFLKGRPFQDAIDFTARICGICPVAYQMSAVHAIEKIFGVEVRKQIRDLRRLMYCAEWISSHSLHVYMLHGPDFYGLESAWSGKEYLPVLKRGLFFKRLGNEILSILGGRSIHPVNVRVGGFYRTPELKKLAELLPSLEKAFEDTIKEIGWASGLNFKGVCQEREYISLKDEMAYPMNYGSVVSNKGLNVTMEDYLGAIEEYQRGYSTALFSGIKRGGEPQPYLVGPLARLNHNYDKLPDEIRGVMDRYGIEIPLLGMDKGIIARIIEIAYAIYESIKIIKGLETEQSKEVESYSESFEPRSGSATWITEAPRGILIHQYELDEKGRIANCKIIPPTSQNLAMIEQDIRNLIESERGMDKGQLKKAISSLIRSYDPCISCSVHLL